MRETKKTVYDPVTDTRNVSVVTGTYSFEITHRSRDRNSPHNRPSTLDAARSANIVHKLSAFGSSLPAWLTSKTTHLVNSVKHQFLLLDDQPESITPVPSVVFDDPMSVDLDPEVKGDQGPTKDPAEEMGKDGLVGREVKVGEGEEAVGEKVAGEYMPMALALRRRRDWLATTHLRRMMSTS